MKEHADVYKAAGDETRLTILALLAQHGECCVCDVMEVCEVTQSKASRHLQTLRHAGLVLDRREGTWVHYRLHPRPAGAPGAFLDANAELLRQLGREELAGRITAWNARKAAGATCHGLMDAQRRCAKETP
jgi:ArsR family transcriptional regulator